MAEFCKKFKGFPFQLRLSSSTGSGFNSPTWIRAQAAKTCRNRLGICPRTCHHLACTYGFTLDDGSRLYVVTGWEKARSWELASHHSARDVVEFHDSFSLVPRIDHEYQWIGRFPAQKNDSSDTNAVSKQTMFMHGFYMWRKRLGRLP